MATPREEFSKQIPETKLSRLLFADTRFAIIWLIIRLYVGWQWLLAGYEKIINPVWVGDKAGIALKGFLVGALSKASGPHPDVQSWYAAFVNGFVIHHLILFSYMVSFGELLVGIGLILGAFTTVAAFFGAFMNMNYLLAGTVSTNPILLVLEVLIIAGWRIAGWFGLDHFILSKFGVPWHPGPFFKKKR